MRLNYLIVILGLLAVPVAVYAVEIEEADTRTPTPITDLRRISPINDLTPEFQWSDATDDVGVHTYWLRIDSGRAKNIGPASHYEVTNELRAGIHTVEVWAADRAGNEGSSVKLTFPVGDLIVPSPPSWIRRTTEDTNFTPTFTWPEATDNVGVDHYEVQLSGTHLERPHIRWKDVGLERVYAVPERNKLDKLRAGMLRFEVRAVDEVGNKSVPATYDFWPPAALEPERVTPHPYAGRLMKLRDDNDPTTFGDAVVYYLGKDGKRHIFPNEGVYWSWYPDFSLVQTVMEDELRQFPVGDIILHRPGARLVKLPNDPKVYAVSRAGELRHIRSEAIARELYGEDWNQKIDVIGEALFGRYREGGAIRSGGHFRPADERDAVRTIDDNKEIEE